MNNFDKKLKEKSLAEGWADEKYNRSEIESLCFEHGMSFLRVRKYYREALKAVQ